MSHNPLVSVCVPCHNAARHLRAALESVFAQTYQPIEVVAVNDGSSDGTGELLDQYAASHGVIVEHTALGSAAKSRNLAFSRSCGSLIKYFDADDVMSTNLVELQVRRLDAHGDCIASSRWKRFVSNLEERQFEPDATWTDCDSIDWLVASLRDGGAHAMMQCGMFLIPRELIDRAGGWDERLSLIDDTEFFGRLIASTRRVLFTEGALYYRSAIAGSLSARKSRSAYESAVLAVDAFCRNLTEREGSDRTRLASADLCLAYAFEIAPFQPDLGKRLQQLCLQYGGSQLKPSGGPVFRLLASTVGWRTASRWRCFAKSLGYARFRQRLGRIWIPSSGNDRASMSQTSLQDGPLP